MWIIFSILAALCWAVINIVDKYIITKWVRKPIIPVIILSFISLVASIIIYFIKGFSGSAKYRNDLMSLKSLSQIQTFTKNLIKEL